MRLGSLGFLFLVTINALAATICIPTERNLASGLHYEQLCRKTPQGEPWSIHVLRVARNSKLRIHAVAGHNEAGQMARELPTAMAERDLARGHRVIAVVNGDFDTVKPESNFGVSVGLSVVEGRLWTGDQTSRPVLAFTQDNRPLIGVPKLTIELHADKLGTKIATFNKPMTAGATALFTSQYRPELQLPTPSSALLAEHSTFDHPLPLYKDLKAHVTSQSADITQLRVPAKTIAFVPSPITATRKRLRVRLEATVNDHRIRDAVGGFPIIVRDNHVATEGAAVTGNLAMRHPRTAVCYNRNSIFFTVVDGRQPTLSVGMTLTELTQFMIELGCDVAMNTDGGGSSVMALADGAHLHIVNSPSDGHERGRGNAWIIETR